MSRAMVVVAFLAALAMACSGTPDATGVAVRDLGSGWVTPESCSRAEGGWLVSDTGCGHTEKDCPAGSGKVVFVGDNGSTKVVAAGFGKPNGVTVDAEGNTWVAVGGDKQIVAVRPDGTVVKTTVPGAGLLNDVTPAGFYPGTVFVSDSKTGAIYIAHLSADGVIAVSTYTTIDDAPNGLAWTGDGLAVATLGSLTETTAAGTIRRVAPAAEYDGCAEWHGGQQADLGGPPHRKLDGLVEGVQGALYASAITDTTVTEDKNDTTIWRIDTDGAATQVYDVGPLGLSSAADIGRDPKTGDLCLPDYAWSYYHPGSPARVVIVSGIQ